MTKRCHHEYETKPSYPDELLCQKCQSCWTITDYLDWDAKRLATLPKGVRYAVIKRQAEAIKAKLGEA
jgi:hypothetical protein